MNAVVPPGFEHEARNLAIDFDGVLHNFDKGYHDGTCYGDPIPGAIEAVRRLASEYRIVVFSSKARPDRPLVQGKTGVELIWDWLHRYGLDEVVEEVTHEKPRAVAYIDDHGIRFHNWDQTLIELDKYYGNL